MNLERIFRHPALAAVLFIVSQTVSAAVNTSYLDAPAARAPATGAAVSDAALEKKQRPRDRSAAPANAGARRNTVASAHPIESRDTGKAQQVKGQTARANSGRVRSLLNRQALRTRTAATASRHAAATNTAVGGRTAAPTTAVSRNGAAPTAANPSQGRANLSQGPASAMPNKAASRAAAALPQNSTARIGTLGGPRVQGRERLGGPISAKNARAAAIDGTQMPRRKY